MLSKAEMTLPVAHTAPQTGDCSRLSPHSPSGCPTPAIAQGQPWRDPQIDRKFRTQKKNQPTVPPALVTSYHMLFSKSCERLFFITSAIPHSAFCPPCLHGSQLCNNRHCSPGPDLLCTKAQQRDATFYCCCKLQLQGQELRSKPIPPTPTKPKVVLKTF